MSDAAAAVPVVRIRRRRVLKGDRARAARLRARVEIMLGALFRDIAPADRAGLARALVQAAVAADIACRGAHEAACWAQVQAGRAQAIAEPSAQQAVRAAAERLFCEKAADR